MIAHACTPRAAALAELSSWQPGTDGPLPTVLAECFERAGGDPAPTHHPPKPPAAAQSAAAAVALAGLAAGEAGDSGLGEAEREAIVSCRLALQVGICHGVQPRSGRCYCCCCSAFTFCCGLSCCFC